jgi:succinate-semialdehyde dehydrogenase / glutarate-semialdehyde dehydrogenase
MTLESRNPMNGELIREYPEDSEEDVRAALLEASRAFAGWRGTTFAVRAQKMRAAADRIDARKEDLARLMALEMGKPLVPGRAELDKCASTCRYYADNAERFLANEPIDTEASTSFIAYNPLGAVLAVMPWNFPFWQVFRFAAPALMAGNVALLKHASNVSGCALAIQEIFREAGFPEPVFRTLLVGSERVGAIIDSPAVKAVTLTGSTPAGQSVASRAGHALKKTVLELGGSDPYVVLEDADLEPAAEACVTSRLINSGQSCIAAKRFIVVEPVRKRFEELFVEKMRSKKMGDPLEPGIELGPLARHDLRDSVHTQVEATVRAGARVLLGGKPAEGKGAFYPPTVLAGVRKGMVAFDEEVFGPVAAIVSARDEDEAVKLANDSPFGLGAAVFTRDLKRGERIAAHALEAGNCFVNAIVRSDPRLPFGGIKESGYGRELSHLGIREFVNIKTVYVK